MKVALYIADGVEQIILTPTDDAEKAILAKLPEGDGKLFVARGQFYVGNDRLMHSAAAGYSRQPDSTYLFLSRKHAADAEQ